MSISLPASTYPFVDPVTGRINPIWYQYLSTLQQITTPITSLAVGTGGVTVNGNISAINATFTGKIELGQFHATLPFSNNGYIIIYDDFGTARRVMVG